MKPICATVWSGCSCQHQVWTIEPADPGLHGGTGGWGRGSKAALPLGDSEIRDQIGGWATDSAVCAPDEPRSWRSFCHWWNYELCLFSASLMTSLNLTTLPHHAWYVWPVCASRKFTHDSWLRQEAVGASLLGLRVKHTLTAHLGSGCTLQFMR